MSSFLTPGAKKRSLSTTSPKQNRILYKDSRKSASAASLLEPTDGNGSGKLRVKSQLTTVILVTIATYRTRKGHLRSD